MIASRAAVLAMAREANAAGDAAMVARCEHARAVADDLAEYALIVAADTGASPQRVLFGMRGDIDNIARETGHDPERIESWIECAEAIIDARAQQ